MQWLSWSNNKRCRAVLWVGTAVCTLLTACIDDEIDSPIPLYNVNLSINLSTEGGAEPGEVALSIPGGWCTVQQWSTLSSNIGVGGLLVVHDIFDVMRYHAFDLACPYCYQNSHGEKVVATKMTAYQQATGGYGLRCEKCESEFGYVLQGQPVASAGPANHANVSLRRYKATQAAGVVYVSR